jgi:4-hydroxy-3-methylbut-2-enyl diphosphate reductase
VIDVVKGGVIAVIKGVRAFVPSSQVSSRYVENLEQFKGKEMNFQILQYDREKRRIIAGRKALAAKELAQKKEEVYGRLEVGQKVSGTVTHCVAFGAFVDLGGVEGLIHISQLSWGRVRKVSDVLHDGDKVVVTVLDIDREKDKISLSLKDFDDDPWKDIEEKYPVGAVVRGQVARMVSFGAFVELEEGIDGLVHISQIAERHIARPEEELTVGQVINVLITHVDPEAHKISLSKKLADAAMGLTAPAYEDEAEEEEYGDDEDYEEEAVTDEPEETIGEEPSEEFPDNDE